MSPLAATTTDGSGGTLTVAPVIAPVTAPTDDLLHGSAFRGYAYAYPHKLAYRALEPAVPLADVWRDEDRSRLFLYVHLPFCEMRCGFCNLLTIANRSASLVDAYLDTLEQQAIVVRQALGPAEFAIGAIGGGTPSVLDLPQLERLFAMLRRFVGRAELPPLSFEFSPDTVTREKVEFLRANGVHRVSMGIQSFVHAETKALGRPQQEATVYQAVELLKAAAFPVLNLDLIYGTAGQTATTWEISLRATVALQPEEIYLYPLYVRPLTGLGKQGRAWDDQRLDLYRQGRDFLLASGYEQVSMRYFRRPVARACPSSPNAPAAAIATTVAGDGLRYCCQDDGMVGLGAGARSYTRHLHLCTEYGVGRASVRAIIDDYIQRTPDQHAVADYGIRLDADALQRRFVIKSLLRVDGLDEVAYRRQFGHDATAAYPELDAWHGVGLLVRHADVLRLTAAGMERADAIGPALYSPSIRELIEAYDLT